MKNCKKSTTILSHYTALELLRYSRIHEASLSYSNHLKRANFHCSVSEFKELKFNLASLLNYKNKIDILVTSDASRVKSKALTKDIVNHVCSVNLPTRSFVKIRCSDKEIQSKIFDKVVISSPELVFLQLAENKLSMSFIGLALYGMELCGKYVVSDCGQGFSGVKTPLTTKIKIQNYLTRVTSKHIRGFIRAKYTVKWIANNSASPMESKMYIVLCGPRKYGAYQIKSAVLNKKISLSEGAKIICGQTYIIPDMKIKNFNIAIEYDSKQYHEKYIQGQKDKRRRDALCHDGWKVFTIVNTQIGNINIMNNIVKDIVKAYGRQLEIRTANFNDKQYKLFTAYFGLQY